MNEDAPVAPLAMLGDPQALACEGDACLIPPGESSLLPPT
jgi:hypothetical protein